MAVQQLLVVGGGWVGSSLVAALAAAFPEAALTWLARDEQSAPAGVVRGERLAVDPAQADWAGLFAGRSFDGIVHAAALEEAAPEPAALDAGLQGLLAWAEPALTPMVHLIPAAAVYGVRPGVRREADAPAPADARAAAFVQCDAAAQRAAMARPAWRLAGLRVFPVYGARAEGATVACAVHRLYAAMKAGRQPQVPRPGTQKHDFVYAPDVAAMTVAALRARRGGVFNCGSGQGISPLELVSLLNRELGTDFIPEPDGDGGGFPAAAQVADMKKARYELGFEPKWSPAAGIADYVARREAGD